MLSRAQILNVTCPTCGAAPGTPCLKGNRGKQRADHPRRVQRAGEEVDFWNWVDDRVRMSGRSEQEVLDSIRLPGWTGRKARTRIPAAVIEMPVRMYDRRRASAGDFDDAA